MLVWGQLQVLNFRTITNNIVWGITKFMSSPFSFNCDNTKLIQFKALSTKVEYIAIPLVSNDLLLKCSYGLTFTVEEAAPCCHINREKVIQSINL